MTLKKPELLALLHSLPHSITTISACMAPALPWDTGEASREGGVRSTGLIAAATVGGHIEIVKLAQGSLMPLQPHTSISLGQSSLLLPRVGGRKYYNFNNEPRNCCNDKINSPSSRILFISLTINKI
jgi:hypothetical protein